MNWKSVNGITARLRMLPGITCPLLSREMARRMEALARSCSSALRMSHRMARMAPFFLVKRYVSETFSRGRFTFHTMPLTRTMRNVAFWASWTWARPISIITMLLMRQPKPAKMSDGA